MPDDGELISVLVSRVAEGSAEAEGQLADTLYHQLRAVARRHLASERAGHTLSATALVHEAYLKIAAQRERPAERAHFLAVASMAMRRVLVSHARQRRAQKRGSGEGAVTLDDSLIGGATDLDGLLALDAALTRLEALSERQARALTHKGFGALTDAEIATALGVSVPTVRRDLRLAAAFMKRELAS
jgi:RNA polymerase sigma factor (TIGR02999 family)